MTLATTTAAPPEGDWRFENWRLEIRDWRLIMPTNLEDLKVLQAAEGVADDLWQQVMAWNEFARDTLGKQAVRAVESFGRFNFGEKLQFLYYARGSLFETKYWL